MKNIIQLVSSMGGAFLGFYLGSFDGFLLALLAFVVIDYISGVIYAIYQKKVSSEIGFKGIIKKIFIFVLVGIGNIIDCNIFNTGSVFRNATIFFYLSNEGISILENVANLGLPVPDKLKQILKNIEVEK